ncbi:MAG: hypothetical protein CL923_03930 [Deltaproteobacteria bacterium]|jgi:hypothetical protein|nr:hypothetical protein [Deltaproteobacteria bacterium]MBQ31692.1 hypothetical protein [Deltaproteobacteria bacterium]MDP7318193.1 DUF2784 domain-containing protein [SAR324 cluster bacterium]MDP7463239.1 DUF2784 domain-containing protein [SAR324 cluster bacterium]
MLARLIADALLIAHLLFVAFAVAGAVLLLRWPWLVGLHLPAAAWAVIVEWRGGACPLTDWEKHWRQQAGESGYEGGFVESVLLPVIYPPGLTPELMQWLGVGVLAINLLLYGGVLWHWRTAS